MKDWDNFEWCAFIIVGTVCLCILIAVVGAVVTS